MPCATWTTAFAGPSGSHRFTCSWVPSGVAKVKLLDCMGRR